MAKWGIAVSFIFLFLLAFSSCTPLRVVRVAPERESEVARYDYGSAVLEAHTTEATVGVGYYDATAEYLVFNLEITNQGTEAMLFDPAIITLTTESAVVPAIDPEMYLLEHDLTGIRDQRRARAMGWVGAGLMVASAVSLAIDVPLVNVGNEVVAQELAILSTDLALIGVNAAQNSHRQAYLPPPDMPTPEQRAFWVDHTLRITTIAPGETAFGKILFLRQDGARNLRLAVPLPTGGAAHFNFVQVTMRG
jgi:hypothetical protein